MRSATGNRCRGFTLVEVLVAVSIAVVLCGLCIAIYVKVNAMKSRSEKLLFLTEEANGALGRIARDLGGLYVGGANLADYWKLEKEGVDPLPAEVKGDRLTFSSATENPGKADYCKVCYYVKKLASDKSGKLYRVLSDGIPPGGAWSANEADWMLADGVDKITFAAEPAAPAAGSVPKSVTVTLQMADPGGTPGYRRFTVTLRPGSEEN